MYEASLCANGSNAPVSCVDTGGCLGRRVGWWGWRLRVRAPSPGFQTWPGTGRGEAGGDQGGKDGDSGAGAGPCLGDGGDGGCRQGCARPRSSAEPQLPRKALALHELNFLGRPARSGRAELGWAPCLCAMLL